MKSLIIFFFVLFNSAKCQPFHSRTDISWSNSRFLKWEDFTGKVDDKSDYKALTTSSIICKPYFVNDSILLWVESIFVSERSWKKKVDLDSFDLVHEQTHFNMTEIFARKLRIFINNEIKSAKNNYTTELLQKIESAFQRLSKECEEIQELYDNQTSHSINKNEQIRWNNIIWNDLKKLNDGLLNSFFIGNIIISKN